MNIKKVDKLFKQTIIINSILFLIVILSVTQISFDKAADALYDELTVANKTVLHQTTQNIDAQLMSIDTTIDTLSANRAVTAYASNDAPSAFDKYDAIDPMRKAVSTNGIITDILLYSTASKTMVATSSSYSTIPESYINIIENSLSASKDAWTTYTDDSVEKIMFTKPLSAGNGVLLVKIHESLLYESISKYRSEENGMFFVVDNKGTILSHNNKAYISKNIDSESFSADILQSSSKSGSMWADYLGENSLIIYSRSGYTGWTYIGAISEHLFDKRINIKKAQSYLIDLLIFLASITFAYWLVKKMYTPMDRFVHSVASKITKNNSSQSILEDFGTLNDLESNFSALMDQHYAMKSEYDKNAKALSWNIIMNMLLGFSTNYDEFISSLETTNISLYPQNFIVILTDISAVDYKNEQKEELVLVSNVVLSKLNTLLNRETKGCSISVGEHGIVSVVSFENNSEAANVSQAISLINELISFSQKYFKYKISVSLGHFYENVSGLHKSYTEASCAMKYKSINHDGSILMIDDYLLNADNSPNFNDISNAIENLVSNFKDFDEESLHTTVSELMAKMIAENIDFNLCKQFVLQAIMLVVTRYIRPLERQGDTSSSRRYLNSNQQIDSCSDIPSMFDAMLKILFDIHVIYNERNNSTSSQNALVNQALEYIDNHYMNSNTSLSIVAESLGVSDSHLSRIFKAQIGKRFMEYLIHKRIEKAKELLISEQYKVNDIAALVGYDNQISFMKIFKKYTGITPSEFKNMNIK